MMKLTIVSIPKRLYFKMLCLAGLCFAFSQNGASQSLNELKQVAAEENLELKALYKRFEAQLESVDQAKAWQDPNLSFGYFISPIETRVGPQVARFSLTQMLPWFGTFKAKGNLAANQAEAEFQKFQDRKLQLFLNVAEQYYDLSALEYQHLLEIEQLSILEDIKVIVQSQYENNKARLIDIYRVELDIDKQENTLQVINNQKAVVQAKLNQLINKPVSNPILIEDPQSVLEAIKPLVVQDSVQNHPRIQRFQSLKASALENKILAQKQSMPQFGIGLDYAIIQDQNVMNADAGQDAIMPMLSVSLPIFGKKNRSRQKAASFQEEAFDFELKNEIQRLNTDIEIAGYKREELMDVLALYDRQLSKLENMVELAETGLANANTDIEVLLDLHQEQLMLKKQRVETLAGLQKNYESISYLNVNTEK